MKKSRFDRRTELFYKTDHFEENSGSAPDRTLGSAEKPMRGDMGLRSISDSGDNACCVLRSTMTENRLMINNHDLRKRYRE